MHCDTLPAPVHTATLRLPWIRDGLTSVVTGWRDAWRLHRCRVETRREIALAAELDPRVLRDIGAPDHLFAEALARRQAAEDHRERLLRGAGGWQHW